MDLDAEINRSKTLESGKRRKGHPLVLFSVDSHDEFAAPPQEFIHTEILDVSSIGHVKPRGVFIHRSTHFLQQKPKTRRASVERCALGRIPDPIAEANIEQCKPEGQSSSGA